MVPDSVLLSQNVTAGMQRRLVLEFTKMSGAGNDFVVLDNRFYHFSDEELGELARRLCHRRFGIGADGLLAFSAARDPAHHYRMRYLNADGSVGTMCGNGARCLVRFGRWAGVTDTEVRFESDAGVVRAHAPEDMSAPVRIYLGPPRDYMPDRALAAGDAPAGPVHYIWTGTEHLVCFVSDVASTPVEAWGRRFRHDDALKPNGANVDFAEVADDGEGGDRAVLRVRTFEKGVEDETYACGTGAIASAVVARLQGQVQRETVDVEMPGGTLRVGFTLDDGAVRDVYLEGPADIVFRGTIEVF